VSNPDLNIDLLSLLPPWYREILDYQEICKTEQEEIDALANEIVAVGDNFYIQTMGETAIADWENIFGIIPNIYTETLEFRRSRILNRLSSRPPYTMEFLRQQLDRMLGPGNWEVRMDYEHYTMYIEASAEDFQYANEISVTIGKIKPAHIVYISVPFINYSLELTETISSAERKWNYRLGAWALFSQPFQTITNEGVIKMANMPSVQPELLNGVAGFVSSDIASVRINGSIVIEDITKEVNGNTLTVSYGLTQSQVTEVTKIELLDAAGNALTSSTIYVAVANDGVQLKHTIPVKEGN